jgi:Fe-S cluster biosynthesis and repair protein YggX
MTCIGYVILSEWTEALRNEGEESAPYPEKNGKKIWQKRNKTN